MSRKIAIISSHLIQYNAPLFALMNKEPEIDLMVFYTWGEGALGPKYDPDFGKEIEWDIPLLDGYNYTFLKNTAKEPGSHHFNGIINPTLNKEIEEWGPDVVWVWGWSFDSHLKAMRYFKSKVPVWFRGDSTLLDEPKGFSSKKIIRRIFLKWVYSNIDKAFYVGTHNKAYFKAHGLKENQLVYAPHAIDNLRFSYDDDLFQQERVKFKAKHGIDENSTIILYAGKLEPRKNPLFLIELMRNLKSNKFKLIIVGNGPLLSALKRELKNDKRVIFSDFVNQKWMPNLYKLAHFFILPSLSETWGLALNEALASGTPIIASDKCGGAIDLINQSNGYLFNCKSIDFNDLGRWMENFNLHQFITRNTIFFQRFSYEQFVKQVICNL
ncbi:MAG: glycosyltransferase family 4 protein [Bacteroidota bacterium]